MSGSKELRELEMIGRDPAVHYLKQMFPESCWPHIWVTGGLLRDILSGESARDIDLTAALPTRLLTGLGFRLVTGKSTAPIWFRHDSNFGVMELTLLAGPETLRADLSRRDFTVNALALSLTGKITDLFGGTDDIRNRQLRTCSLKAFRDDPLRIFRAFRFEAEGWRMTPECEELVRADAWDNLSSAIPVERFSREMMKAMAAPDPGRFFAGMVRFNIGREWLPELFRMASIPAGPVEYHPEGDLLTHSMQVLERVAAITADPLTRFCAFFHDLGKLSTDPIRYPKHHGHDEAGFGVAREFCRRLALPVSQGKALSWISRLHGKANMLNELRTSTRLRVAEQAIKGGIAEILPLVATADRPGNDFSGEWEKLVSVAGMGSRELGIDPERLALLRPAERPAFILQQRLEWLRINPGFGS